MIDLYLDNRKVDVSEDFKVNMTYQQSDLSSPEAKLNSFSKTISLFGTKNNNKIFGHIFRFDTMIQDGNSLVGINFDPNKRIPFALLNNGVLYERGYAQLDKVVVKKGKIEYQMTLYGNVGLFFYNLMYNEDGTEKTLNDLTWGFYVNGNKLTEQQENNSILFEYNKEFVKRCWAIRNSQNFGTYNEMDINKFICPIPCYQGYYDNFDSNKVIINVNDLDLNTYDWNVEQVTGNVLNTKYTNVDGKQRNDYYTYKDKGLLLCEMDRDVSEYEIGDLRSHYQPYGLRLKGLFDAITNKDNNGGFNVNIDNIDPIEMKYLDNAYIMQDRFSWDDIKEVSDKTIRPTFGSGAVYNDGSTMSDVYDLSDYTNPNISVYVYPELQPKAYQNKQLKTRVAACAKGWDDGSTGDVFLEGKFGNSIQYFYLNILDENNNIIKTSDIYLYGDYQYNPYDEGDEHNSCMVTDKTSVYFHEQVDIFADCSIWSDTIISMLRHQNKKIKRGSDAIGRWLIPEDLIADNDDPNAVSINTSHRYDGYSYNNDGDKTQGDWDCFVGEKFKIDTDLPKGRVKIQLVGSAVSMLDAVNASSQFHNGLLKKAVDYEPYPKETDVTNSFKSFYVTDFFEKKLIGRYTSARNYQYEKIIKTIDTNYRCHIEGETTIYDGSAGSSDEAHLVSKYGLFMNTKTPYDYLISMGKMFNWKFESDPFTNDIIVYSFNNYYKDSIIDITDKLVRDNYTITPTTSKYANYECGLELIDSYPEYVWEKANKTKYGVTRIKTNYQFNKEVKELMEDVEFNNAAPYRQNSVFFNKPFTYNGRLYYTPSLGKRVKLTLWNSNDDDVELTLRGALGLDNRPTQNVASNSILLGMFDDEFGHLDSTDVICFYDRESTINPETNTAAKHTSIMVSDNFPSINQLSGNNCYYWALDANQEIFTDCDNDKRGYPAYKEQYPPVFRSYFVEGNTAYYGTMKAENEETVATTKPTEKTSIYDICWKNYLNDLYNKNNKIVNVKVVANIKPIEAMKKIYTFDNALWVMNKITDYNIDDLYMNIEFVQIQNRNNYVR